MAQRQGPRFQMIRLIFWSLLNWQEGIAENFQSTRSPTQCRFDPVSNMVSKRNYLLYHFSITIHLHLASSYATIYFREKKLATGEMLIEKIIEFELRGPGPPGRTYTSISGYFHDKTKISKEYL